MDENSEIVRDQDAPVIPLGHHKDQQTRLVELNRELIKRKRKRMINVLATSTAAFSAVVVAVSMALCGSGGLESMLMAGGVVLVCVVGPMVVYATLIGVGLDRQSRKQLRYLEGEASSHGRELHDEGSTVAELEAERQAILLEINSGRGQIARREGGVSLYEDERARGALSVEEGDEG